MAFWNRKDVEFEGVGAVIALEHGTVNMQRGTRHSKAFDLNSDSAVSNVISLLLDQPEWDYAIDQESAFENALFAAANFGVKRPFSDEQKDLFGFLENRFAGKKMAVFAWGLYADHLKEQRKKSA